MTTTSSPSGSSRRDFLKASAATVAAGALAAPAVARHAFVAGREEPLRVGLVGCGGRGTGAAADALGADPNVRLVAMGDLFGERITAALGHLEREKRAKGKVEVPPERRFTGFDAYRQVIDAGIDVVLLCSPPHFRPAQIEYAVEKGVHLFAEKPVAVDGPGVRRVMAACEAAKAKNLAVVSGLCWRYDAAKRATLARVLEGGIGDLRVMQCTYNTGALWMNPRQPGWSDMEWQLRNWLYFTWLSGDHIVEQHIHSIDKTLWAMKDVPPVKAVGVGGRQVRTDPAYGHVYDHFSITFEWADGTKAFSQCRQQEGCANDVSDHFYGTKGHCDVFRHAITGETPWKWDGENERSMYQVEHDELFASIRGGRPINNGDYMCKSTLMSIMGRMAAYTGQVVTWDAALGSKEDLTPPAYVLGPLPMPPVAMPGFTKFL